MAAGRRQWAAVVAAAGASELTAPAIIKTQDLRRVIATSGNEVRALDGVSLTVEHGEFVALMGPSGSGKSTFMGVIGCLDRPTGGTYRLEGADVTKLSRDERAVLRNRRIGFVFQAFNLLARTSALENVELPLLYARGKALSDAARRAKAMACLERVGVEGRWNHVPSQLSGGEQQRVAIARSLVNDPTLIMADEPTGNLDSTRSQEVMALFQDLNEEGRTIVLVTHEHEVAECARRLVGFRDGHVVSDEAVKQRRADSATAAP